MFRFNVSLSFAARADKKFKNNKLVSECVNLTKKIFQTALNWNEIHNAFKNKRQKCLQCSADSLNWNAASKKLILIKKYDLIVKRRSNFFISKSLKSWCNQHLNKIMIYFSFKIWLWISTIRARRTFTMYPRIWRLSSIRWWSRVFHGLILERWFNFWTWNNKVQHWWFFCREKKRGVSMYFRR